MAETVRKNIRLPRTTVDLIQRIAAHQHGLTETRVILNAVEVFGRQIFGPPPEPPAPPRGRGPRK